MTTAALLRDTGVKFGYILMGISLVVVATLLAVVVGVLLFVALTPIFFVPAIWACMGKGSSPMPPGPEIDAVSGLYGPGAYIAWVLCTMSAIISSATEKNPSSTLSPDIITSLLYSNVSVYWYHGRFFSRWTEGSDILQDYSAQTASFVFNVSTLLHGLGYIFNSKRRKNLWAVFVVWDVWLSWISPVAFAFLARKSIVIQFYFAPMILIITYIIVEYHNPSRWMLVLLPLLSFVLLEALRCQFSTARILVIPKTASNLTDLDQFVSLITAIVVLTYQWKLWNLASITRKLQTRSRRTPVQSV
jgi:hypothetical protein